MKQVKSKKDIYCVNCGVRTGLLTRAKFVDGKCLCLKCQCALPTFLNANIGKISSQEYSGLFEYMNTQSKELSKVFKKRHKFSHLQLDTVNKILRYKYKQTTPIYINVDDISYFNLDFKGGKVEGIGDIRIAMECNNPKFSIDETLAENEIETQCYDFMDAYYSIKVGSQTNKQTEGYNQGYQNTYEQNEIPKKTSSASEQLQKALALFMFDSLNDVTAESLKAQRNRLIKSFHPDTGSEDDNKYAQKINEAYMILLDYVD